MKADLLNAIREALREDGVLTERSITSRCPRVHRSTAGRAIQQFKQFQHKQEKLLRGDPITGRPVSWELQALRQSQAAKEG